MRSSPKDAMALWSVAPQHVDIPETLAILGTQATEEFLYENRSAFTSLALFITSETPSHMPHILPFCVGERLTTLDIRSTGVLDCHPLRFLPNLETLYVNAMHVKRFDTLPPKLRDLRICISSRLHLDVSGAPELETLHVTADRSYIHNLPPTLKTFRVRGNTCDIPHSLPEALEHVEVSGAIMDAFPNLPPGLKTLNISNTHMEPGQLDLRDHALDRLVAYGTCIENEDVLQYRAKTLDIRWTSITPDVRFHRDVETVYMDMVPTKESLSMSRDHILTIHIGKSPEPLSPACTVAVNNRLDHEDRQSPFEHKACYVKRYDTYRVVCKIWTPAMTIHDIDRLIDLASD